MTLEQQITSFVKAAVKSLYSIDATDAQIQLQKTRPEFEGNITLVVFPFVKMARKAPAQTASEIGEWLMVNGEGLVAKYNAVQGFLNLVINDAFWINQLQAIDADDNYGRFQSPITN
ncbi:MAG: arginine--tRNA ligase, partial [Paludibacteraceae bacterium]|nr:arginine--tRNA ligase [Paludibacteraceae bacterium]